MLEALKSFLEHHELLGHSQTVHYVVAFSGGRDSTVLMHSLKQLQVHYPTKIRLTAAYYCHPWRPLHHDLQAVYQTCQALDIPFVCLTPDLTQPHTETAARNDRYQQLAQLAIDLEATAVLTAHHQDDALETIMFRMFRGTGIEGLTGIPPVRTITSCGQEVLLARPLLNITRKEINEVVQTFSLSYIDDPTNQQTRFSRNKLRLDVIPHIEQAFPDWRHALLKLMEHAKHDSGIIQSKMGDVWEVLYDQKTNSLDERCFLQLDEAFQRRLLRKFLQLHQEDASYQRVVDIQKFLKGQQLRQLGPSLFSLAHNRFLSVYRQRITIENRQSFEVSGLEIPVPCQLSHRDFKVTLTIKELSPEERMKPLAWHKISPFDTVINLSGLEGKPLILRNRQMGDVMTPLGMKQPMKLKKLFKNRGISRFHRDTIPLLATDSTVLWVAGIAVSELIRVKSKPTHRLSLSFESAPEYLGWLEHA